MNHHSEPDDPLIANSADTSRAAVERLEKRCVELEFRLGESEAEKRAMAARLERLQADFDRMESQLLSLLSGKAFRYSRGARRLWARITGG